MNILLTIIVFVLIFSVLILIHELGHFLMAKRAGIKVEEFGLGLPPRIWGKKKGDTIFSINWIPFGGFVRLYGEDSSDPKALRSKQSFVAKPMRSRVLVIVAGVVMNFLLAWFLMTVGFTVGMQPLLAPEDVFGAVDKGQIVLEPGLKIKNIVSGSLAEQTGFKKDDVLISFKGKVLDDLLMLDLMKDPAGDYELLRNGELIKLALEKNSSAVKNSKNPAGMQFYDFAPFPRVEIFNLKENSAAFRSGLKVGDIILKINDKQIYNTETFEKFIKEPVLNYQVYRAGRILNFELQNAQSQRVVISKVLPMAPAEKAGLKGGDIIIGVNDQMIFESLGLINFVKEHQDEVLLLSVERSGATMRLEVKPENGKIGVYLSQLLKLDEAQGLSVYNKDLASSVTEIKDEKYPLHIAVYKAFGETYRLSKLTAKMFVGVIGKLVSSGEVPEGVAGPIGIAQMTSVFVQEGFIPLLRFVAILSLSLAAINILPLPALDGGRLLFIVIELILGRRVSFKWESYIHALGYVLILLLILFVTFSDVMRLIAG